jgi:flagellar hook-basal body complex protein FliE
MSIQTSFAAQLYESASRIAPPAIVPDEPGSAGRGSSFSEALAAAAGDMARTLRAGEAAAQSAMTGQADVQSVVEALTATELALQAAVAVRDRVVEAYQEVLRMPV